MKKKYLIFFSVLIFSLSFFNFKTYAQEEFPNRPKRINYVSNVLITENNLTYEYNVFYYVTGSIDEEITDDKYFFINNINVVFRKGTNRNTNTYEFLEKTTLISGDTELVFRVTVLKSLVNAEYPDDISLLFSRDSSMYLEYLDIENIEYDRGYNDGYDRGYNIGFERGEQLGYNNGYSNGYDTGYDEGYNKGKDDGYDEGVRVTEPKAYQDGYNKGAEEAFIANLHIWLVPAMIIVVITGIFVGYRRKDE